MSLRYTGPNGDYPVYCCRADRDQRGSALCQEVRALPVDALLERVLLDALAPDQIAIALAAMGELEEENRHLERQWTLRRERARYEAERARRQYDAVEPENRLVARSLERAWEDKLRTVEAIEQEYTRWRSEGPLVISAADRTQLQRLGENLPRIWNAATTSAGDHKRILRFVMREVVLDGKRSRGQVWLRIAWQTGATSEHRVQRRVHTYRDYIDIERLRKRIAELNAAGKMDKEIAAILNGEGFVAARGCAFKGENVWLLRTRWAFRPSRSMVSSPIRHAGPMAASRCRARRRRSKSPHKRSLLTLSVDCWPAASSRKGNHGKSISRTSKSIDFAPMCDAPGVRRKRHHESVGSPIISCHRSIGSWVEIS